MEENKQITQTGDNTVTPIKFWGTIVAAGVLLLVCVYFFAVLFRQPGAPVIYIGMAVFLFTTAMAVTSIVLVFRHRQELGLKLAFYALCFFIPLIVLLFQGRTLTASLSALIIFAIIIRWLFPRQSWRWYSAIAVAATILAWIIEWINPPWRLQLAAATIGPAAAVVFGIILAIVAVRQTWDFMTVAWKIALIVAVLFLGMAGITVSAYLGIQSLRYQFSNIYDFMLIPITSIQDVGTFQEQAQYNLTQLLRGDISAEERASSLAQIQTDNQSAEKIIARYDTEWVTTTSPQFTQDLKNAGKLNLQQQEVATLASYHTAYDAYKIAVAKYLTTVQAGSPDVNLADDAQNKLEAADIEIDKLIAVNKQFADFSNTSAQAAIQQALLTGGIALGISVLLGLLMSFLVVISITSRLGKLTRSAAAMQEGNLDQTVVVTGHDEVSLLGITFNKMAAQLRDFITSLEERVAARTKDLAIVAEVGNATATILETDRLLQSVVDLTKERFNLYHSHIYLLDENGQNLVLAAGAGEPGRLMVAEKRSIPLNREQSLVARAARERKGVTVNDVTQAPDFLPNPLLPDTRSELAVPMLVGGNLIGVFDIQSDVVGRFTDSDINIQTTLAAQVATSIQNVRSFEQSKSQADLESTVNAIGQKIQRATTVDETLQTAIRELGLALGASRVKANIGIAQQTGDNAAGNN